MADNGYTDDFAVRLLVIAQRVLRRVPGYEWALFLIGDALFWLLGASLTQSAVFHILWLTAFSIRCFSMTGTVLPERSRRHSTNDQRGSIVFLLQLLIACDTATVLVDSFSSSAIV